MKLPILIAALTVTTIGVGAAHADARLETLASDFQPQTSDETLLEPNGSPLPQGSLKLAESESDDDGDDEDGDDEDDGEDDGGASNRLPTPQSGAPATGPAPKNPLINGNGRPSVVVQ
ncbi:hypothetical protein [Dongia sp. agr-C8]